MDPGLPFLLVHQQLCIRSRAYVRLPVRFIPTVRGDFESVLVVRLTSRPGVDGREVRAGFDQEQPPIACQITLVGTGV